MFTVGDLIRGVIISLVVSTLILVGSSNIKSFKASNKANNDDQSGYSDEDVKSMKNTFIIVYFLTICIAVTLIVLRPDLDNPLAVFLCVIGFSTAFLTFTMFYRLDDVIKHLRKQLGSKPTPNATNDTTDRDTSV
jgi:flagellar biosynthesis protein FliP